ncbi:MAG: ABC transporter ATP-binding protein [Geoalkalibacter sp.]|jgi:oligopeptide/dipeptide ABC transporter ATP-binding protein|uniref:ABC transporter ATP-binding protein n=1 Tax=Geoalkalibacter sp. TaxID=3041440 RepID=UPI002A92E64C|nr:ABC transporter ATP-binding protein [Thermodesulfobacteriota bacterium]
MTQLLEIENLHTSFFTEDGPVHAVRGIEFTLSSRETLALVGESGCGKSITSLSILGLIPAPGRMVEGRILYRGADLAKLSSEEMRRIRGNRISMIFQEPMTSLNPVLRIGDQIREVLQLHKKLGAAQALKQAEKLLHDVGIPSARQRLRDYPHSLSGGMRQRVMIAMALACDPDILIADEPTTALDVTIQAQIMDLLLRLKQERDMATLLITHDLGIVAESADRVAIMYAGLIMEYAPVIQIYDHPRHPYTRGLLACVPRLGEKKSRLAPIRGQVPDPRQMPQGCPFTERCPEVLPRCSTHRPGLTEVAPGHLVRCWRAQ